MTEFDKIQDFVAWCDETQKELPMPTKLAEREKAGVQTTENRARTGAKISLYPPAYFKGQYTDLWVIPHAADAAYYISQEGEAYKK